MVRQGIATAIIGSANVGKSTLMNLLSGRERSIVTDIPAPPGMLLMKPSAWGSHPPPFRYRRPAAKR